ncbi:MAG: 2-succinyl-5-enolpyruvyl-6-hydroxy-3-cyclohexene-1-carboxylic-acid synthase [Propionicimonas sp.]|nr:2-succinyl-5-enolpyruvyl-6-hydroxy-3-cyclohexene-1-carboxylic-acid synthase [Propionicimonas sp.]
MSRSYECARTVLAQVLAQGVTDLVLAPGSRSAPLALAAHEAAGAGRLRLHVRVDERTAGFLALGLAKGAGRCAAVATTSGTAVGNLLPAVMEASHAGIPLLVLSADRPADLVGTGANQTTRQDGIFGVFVRHEEYVDAGSGPDRWAAQAAAAVVAAQGRASLDPGPVHLDLALPEPLVPDGAAGWPDLPAVVEPVAAGPGVTVLAPGPRTVVVCGDATAEQGAAARGFAEAAGLPLFAEPSSAARRGPNALRCGRLLLGGDLAGSIRRVVMFGHPTLSRPVTRLLTRADVELVVVGRGPALPDPGHRTALRAEAVALEPAEPSWLTAWQAADRACGARLDALLAGLDYPSGPALAAAVLAGTRVGTVALGNSMAIRDADLAPILDGPVPVLANRGLSGIDGTVSTAAGIALATGEPVTLLCGDLSFVHDANALAIGPAEARPRLRVVVADDAGGAIFATLEYGEDRFAAPFERVFATPSGADPVALARAFGVPARRIGLAELPSVLAVAPLGPEVLVVAVDRDRRRALAGALAACAAAL